jgi:hypothetical protein
MTGGIKEGIEMNRAVLIGLVWFVAIAILTGGVALFRSELSPWFVGFLAIDAVSAVLLIEAVRQYCGPV